MRRNRINFSLCPPHMSCRIPLPVRAVGLITEVGWMLPCRAPREEVFTSSCLMSALFGWSGESSLSWRSREKRSRSIFWEDSCKRPWAYQCEEKECERKAGKNFPCRASDQVLWTTVSLEKIQQDNILLIQDKDKIFSHKAWTPTCVISDVSEKFHQSKERYL